MALLSKYGFSIFFYLVYCDHNQGLVTIDGDVAIAMRRAIVHKDALKAAALRVCA